MGMIFDVLLYTADSIFDAVDDGDSIWLKDITAEELGFILQILKKTDDVNIACFPFCIGE